jgi:hypothetical protein
MKQASEIGERDNVTDRLWAEADAGECNCGWKAEHKRVRVSSEGSGDLIVVDRSALQQVISPLIIWFEIFSKTNRNFLKAWYGTYRVFDIDPDSHHLLKLLRK